MSISYPPSINPPATGVNTVALTLTNVSAQIIAPNPARAAGAMIVNNSNKTVWIRLGDNTIGATANGITSIPVPPTGGNYVLPATYQGAVQGLFVSAATGTVQFVEPYV